jgi:NADH-ubiquinone oxidoreductase chain 5
MEGPTPVSALLHAATMVTAGVFLVIRSSLFFEYSNNVLVLLCIFGTITALFGSFVATFQYDVKKIIAYSTCSQLGYMFFSCGLSNYSLAFFHLFNHAFFKALLFLSAGALIHSLFDEQDIRKMGNLVIFLPFIYISIVIGSLAILGFPFLSGFYSKDLILELVFSRYIVESTFIYLLSVLAAIFTAIYSFKILFYVFFIKEFNLSHIVYLF